MSISSSNASPWQARQFWEKYLIGQKDFSQLNLSGIMLCNSIFYNLCLDEVNLTNAILARITLSGTSLQKAQITCVNLNNAKLTECDFKDASLRQSSLVGANLEKADLRGVDFSHADLHHANLTHSRLEGADFRNANLEKVRFQGALYSKDTRFDDDFNPAAHDMKCMRPEAFLDSAECHFNEERHKAMV